MAPPQLSLSILHTEVAKVTWPLAMGPKRPGFVRQLGFVRGHGVSPEGVPLY